MEQPDILVGNNLKRIREARNLSYTQLSDLTDVSKSMLRQIEIGESSPTINTLWKIANGLEVPFSMLINPPSPGFAKQGFTDRQPITGTTEGYRLYPLITFETRRNFEIYYVEIDPDVSLDADPHTGNAEEFIMVIEGELAMQVQDERIALSANEILSFDAGFPHRYHNPSQQLTRAMIIISYSG